MLRTLTHLFVLFVAALCMARVAVAQGLSITLTMSPQPSPYLSMWKTRQETVILTVGNANGAAVQAKIRCIIRMDGDRVAMTNDSKMPVQSFPVGTTVMLAEKLVPFSSVDFFGSAKNVAIKTGMLPSGMYQICLRLLNPDNSDLTEERCASFLLTDYQGPILLMPAAETVLRPQERPTFRWTPVTPTPPHAVRYRVQVFEVLAAQRPMQAFKVNRPILDKEVVGLNQMIWPPEYQLPGRVKQYIWTVRALDEQGRPIGAPDGYAEPMGFFVSGGDSPEALARNLGKGPLVGPSKGRAARHVIHVFVTSENPAVNLHRRPNSPHTPVQPADGTTITGLSKSVVVIAPGTSEVTRDKSTLSMGILPENAKMRNDSDPVIGEDSSRLKNKTANATNIHATSEALMKDPPPPLPPPPQPPRPREGGTVRDVPQPTDPLVISRTHGNTNVDPEGLIIVGKVTLPPQQSLHFNQDPTSTSADSVKIEWRTRLQSTAVARDSGDDLEGILIEWRTRIQSTAVARDSGDDPEGIIIDSLRTTTPTPSVARDHHDPIDDPEGIIIFGVVKQVPKPVPAGNESGDALTIELRTGKSLAGPGAKGSNSHVTDGEPTGTYRYVQREDSPATVRSGAFADFKPGDSVLIKFCNSPAGGVTTADDEAIIIYTSPAKDLSRQMGGGSGVQLLSPRDGAQFIRRDADDESEMGAYHDLYQGWRTILLASVPKEMDPRTALWAILQSTLMPTRLRRAFDYPPVNRPKTESLWKIKNWPEWEEYMSVAERARGLAPEDGYNDVLAQLQDEILQLQNPASLLGALQDPGGSTEALQEFFSTLVRRLPKRNQELKSDSAAKARTGNTKDRVCCCCPYYCDWWIDCTPINVDIGRKKDTGSDSVRTNMPPLDNRPDRDEMGADIALRINPEQNGTIEFKWSPPSSIPPNSKVRYMLNIAEITESSNSATKASADNAIAIEVLEKNGVEVRDVYRRLRPGARYAWGVDVYLNNVPTQRSDTWHFTFIDEQETGPNDGSANQKDRPIRGGGLGKDRPISRPGGSGTGK